MQMPGSSQWTIERISHLSFIWEDDWQEFQLVRLVGEKVAGTLSMRVQQLDVKCETKTKDNVFVQVVVSVQYQVMKNHMYDAFYRLTDSRSQITSYVFDVVRATVPTICLDDVFTTKDEIASGKLLLSQGPARYTASNIEVRISDTRKGAPNDQVDAVTASPNQVIVSASGPYLVNALCSGPDVMEQLSIAMKDFGFMIIQTLVTDIEPDMKVRAAMNEINAAQRLRVAAVEKAEAEKVQVVKGAEADAEARFLQGHGVARQRQAIVNGLRESVLQFEREVPDVTARDVLELMMMTQYFDCLKDIGESRGATTLFIPHSPAGVSDIAAQVRNGLMQARYAGGNDAAPQTAQMTRQ